MPVFAPSGKATYSVTSTTWGMASCAIELRYASGTSSIATVTGITYGRWEDGSNVRPQASASLYATSCSTSPPWDDDCDPLHPDLDCITPDAVWSLDAPGAVQEGTSRQLGGALGVGLETAFGLAVLRPLETRYPPLDLKVQDGQDVAVQTLECSADTDHRGLKLTAQQPGEHRLYFTAANIEDGLALSFRAFVVERSSLLGSADGAVVDVFERSSLDLQPRYYASDGRTLSGYAPIDVTATATNSRSGHDPQLYTGLAPAEIQVATTVAPSHVVLNVVGADRISELSGLEDATIPLEETYCIPLSPNGPSGAAILGTPPTRPSVRIVGDALSLSQETDLQTVCVYARSPGSGVLEFTWGRAPTSVTLTAEAPK